MGAAGLLVVMLLFADGEGGIAQTDPGDIAFLLGFVGAPWAAGLTVRLRRERETVLRAENRRLEDEQEERARRAVAEERARIAGELHDVVFHAISVTVLQARGARRTLGVDEEQVRRALDAIEHTNTQALGDMRRLLAVLRDTESDRDTHTAAVTRAARRPADPRPGVGTDCRAGHRGRQPRRAARRRPVGVPDHPGSADQRAQACRDRPRSGSGSTTVRTRWV